MLFSRAVVILFGLTISAPWFPGSCNIGLASGKLVMKMTEPPSSATSLPPTQQQATNIPGNPYSRPNPSSLPPCGYTGPCSNFYYHPLDQRYYLCYTPASTQSCPYVPQQHYPYNPLAYQQPGNFPGPINPQYYYPNPPTNFYNGLTNYQPNYGQVPSHQNPDFSHVLPGQQPGTFHGLPNYQPNSYNAPPHYQKGNNDAPSFQQPDSHRTPKFLRPTYNDTSSGTHNVSSNLKLNVNAVTPGGYNVSSIHQPANCSRSGDSKAVLCNDPVSSQLHFPEPITRSGSFNFNSVQAINTIGPIITQFGNLYGSAQKKSDASTGSSTAVKEEHHHQ